MRRPRRFILLLLAVVLALWWLLPDGGPRVAPGTTLKLQLSGGYVEASEPSLLARLLGDARIPFASLLSELRKAERDERIAVVLLRVRPLQIGWAKAQELRDAIQSLSAAGKRTVAFVELASFGANLEYYVASAADEVVLSPATRAPLVGLAAEFFFLGGLWEKLGVELEVERIGDYKSAADFIAGREMSEAHREMANALLDSIDAQFVAGIAEGRDLTPAFVRGAIEQAPFTPDDLRSMGLVDDVLHYDELLAQVGEPVIEAGEYAAVDPSEVGFTPVTQFALVYGSGNVVEGDRAASPGGGEVLAGDRVSRALVEAAEDPEISAIIFRIDSPGGSALASDQVWRGVQRARGLGKPVVASFSDVAASGGYYVACGADAIVAMPGSVTGSIGVVVLRPVLSGLLDKLDIGFASLMRGPRSDLLLSTRRLSPASRELLRNEMASIYELFLERVADGRELERDAVDAAGQGRVYTGEQALELGLIDGLGGLREAVRIAKERLELEPDDDVSLVPYPRPQSVADQVSEALGRLALVSARGPALSAVERRLEEWLMSVGETGPLLLPPFLAEIR